MECFPLPIALHPDFADQELFKRHGGLRRKLNKDFVARKRCIRAERRHLQKRKRVVTDCAVLEYALSLPLIAFTVAVGLNRNKVLRQQIAVSLLVFAFDGLPFRLDFRLEQVCEIGGGGGCGRCTLRLLPKNESPKHENCISSRKIIPHHLVLPDGFRAARFLGREIQRKRTCAKCCESKS